MVYSGTYITETIFMHYEDNANEAHYIELIKSGDEPVFYVTTCCDEDWVWEFYADNAYNYEMVKHTIMDVMFDCDDMDEVMYVLDNVFMDVFADIIVEDECDCDCCEHCGHRDCLN